MRSHPGKKTLWAAVLRHRFSLFFFLFLLLYTAVVVRRLDPPEMESFYYSYFCVDFSFGFASKLLPGALFRAICGKYALVSDAVRYAVFTLLLIFAGLSLLLERFLLNVAETRRRTAFVLLLFFLTGGYTFSMFSYQIGMLDTCWVFLAILFFLFLEQKFLRFLIPLLFLGSLFVHITGVMFFIIMAALVLLYRISVEEERKEKRIYTLIFTVSLVLSAALFLILAPNESGWVCSMEDFHRKMAGYGSTNYAFYDYTFYHIMFGKNYVPDFVAQTDSGVLRVIYYLYYQVKLNLDLFLQDPRYGITAGLLGFSLISPLLIFFVRFHVSRFRKKGTGLRRFCAFLMLVQIPLMILFGILFGTGIDMTRYLTYMLLPPFVSVLTVLYHEKDQQAVFLDRLLPYTKEPAFWLYYLAYALIALSPVV